MSMKLLVTMAIIRRRRKEESKGYIKAKALKKGQRAKGPCIQAHTGTKSCRCNVETTVGKVVDVIEHNPAVHITEHCSNDTVHHDKFHL